MANDFFNPSGYPSAHAAGTSAGLRSELANVAAGFDKLPPLAGNGGETVRVNAGGTALESYTPSTIQGMPALTVVTDTTFAMTANTHVALSNAAASSATLPATPSVGDICWITVANGRNDNTVIRNGTNIMSLPDDLTIDSQHASVMLRYVNPTVGWRLV